MDGHAEQMGQWGSARNIFDWQEPAGQGDLFGSQAGVTEPLGDVIRTENAEPPMVEPLEIQRDRFIENCLQAQEQERLRLGRELHDSTGQLVLALRLSIAHLRRVQGSAAEETVLAEIDETARQLDREIRSFAFLQYPSEIGSGGLAESLNYLARGFATRTGLKVRFTNIGNCIAARDGSALALLRVAQEALMNVHRHARAVHVRISLAVRHGMLQMVVRDDGVGISPEAPSGVGMQGMRHRVERLGGHFSIRRLSHGTEVTAAVPV